MNIDVTLELAKFKDQFKYKYVGGGYFRDSTVPTGTSATMKHGNDVITEFCDGFIKHLTQSKNMYPYKYIFELLKVNPTAAIGMMNDHMKTWFVGFDLMNENQIRADAIQSAITEFCAVHMMDPNTGETI